MPKINEAERKIQEHVIALFEDKTVLGYTFYGNLRDIVNTNIMTDTLTQWLVNCGYNRALADKAVFELTKAASNLQQGLYKANQDVYSLLKYGAKVHENPGEPDKTVYFIDWERPYKNELA